MSGVLAARVQGRRGTRRGVSMYLGPVDSAGRPCKEASPSAHDNRPKARENGHRDPPQLTGLAEFIQRQGRAAARAALLKHGIRQPVLNEGRYTENVHVEELDVMADYRLLTAIPGPYPRSPAPSRARNPQATPTSLLDSASGVRWVKPYTTVDFSKLKQYNWALAKAPRRPQNVAADRLYTNTYGQAREGQRTIQASVETPRSARRALYREESQAETPTAANPPPVSIRPKSQNPGKPRGKSSTTSASLNRRRHMLGQVDGIEEILDIKAVGGRGKSGEGMLFNRVQQSIESIQLAHDRMSPLPHKLRYVERPLKKEHGIYRPMSKTSIKTPSSGSPSSGHYKDFKSAEAYIKYLDSLKEVHVPSPSPSGYHARANTIMSAADSRYLDSHLSNRLLQSVADFNRPGDALPRLSWSRDAITRGSRGPGRPRPLTGASLERAAANDLVIEPMQVPPPRPLVGFELPELSSAAWALQAYEQSLLAIDDYRPPSASSLASEQRRGKETLLVDVPKVEEVDY